MMSVMLRSACALAQVNSSPPFDDPGFRAFMDACASHVGKLAETESYLRTAGFMPAPKDFATRLLHGGPGDVWERFANRGRINDHDGWDGQARLTPRQPQG